MSIVVKLTGAGNWTVPEGVTELPYVLIVGGGAGGGGTSGFSYPAGGGGAGQLRLLTNVAVTPGALISFSVGNGGAGGASGTEDNGSAGGSTTFGATTATGGGGGGSFNAGSGGGSGGGGAGVEAGGAAVDPLYGNDGGAGYSTTDPYPGGGGGGAGSDGLDGVGGGAGGAGSDQSAIFGAAHGVSGFFAGGGAGGVYNDPTAPQSGGSGGGGDASTGTPNWNGGDAVADTGSGGAGAGADDSLGGKGGDGAAGTILLVVPSEFNDWGEAVNPITDRIYYALEVDDGVLDAIRPPISSWQATVQSGRASYAQAVIPAATDWVAQISARSDGEMIVYRGVVAADGTTQESELARAPLGDVRFDVGPTNATMTISGYSTVPPPAQSLTRTLRNVRSESIANGVHRVRCDIDFFLRPGHTAISRGTAFKVAYINYYVNVADEYMDVGERAEPVSPVLLAGQAVANGQALTLVAGVTVTIAAGQSVAGGRALVPDVGP